MWYLLLLWEPLGYSPVAAGWASHFWLLFGPSPRWWPQSEVPGLERRKCGPAQKITYKPVWWPLPHPGGFLWFKPSQSHQTWFMCPLSFTSPKSRNQEKCGRKKGWERALGLPASWSWSFRPVLFVVGMGPDGVWFLSFSPCLHSVIFYFLFFFFDRKLFLSKGITRVQVQGMPRSEEG